MNKNLADKELVYYAFILVLKMLYDNDFISDTAYKFQFEELLQMLKKEEEKREDVKKPELILIERLKEYITMNQPMFGLSHNDNVKRIGDYSEELDEVYITKRGFSAVLNEYKMSGDKKTIITALKKQGIMRERSNRVAGSPTSTKHFEISLREPKEHTEIISELRATGNLHDEQEQAPTRDLAQKLKDDNDKARGIVKKEVPIKGVKTPKIGGGLFY